MDQLPRIKSARDKGLRACLALALLAGCSESPEGAAGIDVRHAALSSAGCQSQPVLAGLPDAVERLVVEVVGDDGLPGEPIVFTRGEDDLGLRELLLQKIPVAEKARLQMYACTAAGLGWYGASPPFAIAENAKTSATVTLRPVERLSCTGTGLDADHDAYAVLARPRAFPAVAALPDGRIFVGGGASKSSVTGMIGAGNLLLAELSEADYEAYDPISTLFAPAFHRGWGAGETRTMRARIAGAAFAVGTAEAPGVLLVGGRSEVSWSNGTYGPLGVPSASSVFAPFAEYLDVATENSAPVLSATGQGLVPRFLPATAQDPVTRTVVVVGGLEFDPAPTPSVWVDLISGNGLRSFPLAQARIGATVTPLGDDRFLVWGGDVTDCGAAPAVLIDARQAAPVRPLGLDAALPASSCQSVGTPRDWWVTAWHAATALGAAADGTQHVLVTGGMEVLQDKVEQTPEIGMPGSPPNVLELIVSADLTQIRVQPVTLPPPGDTVDVAPLLRRAMHSALLVRDRIFIGGGWSVGANGTVAVIARSELVTARVDYTTRGPVDFEASLNLTLSEARLGPAMVGTSDGSVLFAGGFRYGDLGPVVSDTAEVFVPAPTRDLCGTGTPNPVPSPFEFGLPATDAGLTDAQRPSSDAVLPVFPPVPDAAQPGP
jgi:hypothetical protein